MLVTKVTGRYVKEEFEAWEMQSLRGKFALFSFSGKVSWSMIGFLILVFIGGSFFAPIFPPRYRHNWNPPKIVDEYLLRVKEFWIVIPLLLIIVFTLYLVRNKIDLSSGYKRTGVFKINSIVNLGAVKFLFLDGLKLFRIRQREEYFNTVKEGQVILIKRTATYRRISYFISDE